MKYLAIVAVLFWTTFGANAEVQIIDGKTYECKDGLCSLVEETNEPVSDRRGGAGAEKAVRIAQGYMPEEAFIAFLENRPADRLGDSGLWWTLILVLLGGLAMNLTPCVLPMVPVNLMIIGQSARRGAAYGLGITLAYGALGVAAAVGGLAFGAIQSNPWFNVGVAVVFALLAFSLFGVYSLDFSRFRPSAQIKRPDNRAVRQIFFPFLLGALSAVLAGACVAPVLVSVLLLTADLVARGNAIALGLPFVLGLGMALPWPFLGAGLRVLPKPGRWMRSVNRVFGVVVLGFACWYGRLAWQGFRGAEPPTRSNERPASLAVRLAASPRPVLVDCWATWCKNCAAMERVMERPRVRAALEPFAVIRVQAEDIGELRALKGFETIRGLPAFVIFE